ncbi:MAG TPA: hypothetical protein DCY74_05625, partial [Clostridiales bacterium]|nr:hypothetical protein [Clostridiales bacterium]
MKKICFCVVILFSALFLFSCGKAKSNDLPPDGENNHQKDDTSQENETYSQIQLPENITLEVGDMTIITPENLPEGVSAADLTWVVTEGKDLIELSENGIVIGVAPGQVTIEVSYQNSAETKASVTFQVKEKHPLDTLVLYAENDCVQVGKILTICCEWGGQAINPSQLIWSVVSGKACISLSPQGVATGLSPGKTVIRATDKSLDLSATYTIKVFEPVTETGKATSISLSVDSEITVGQSLKIGCTVFPEDAKNKAVVWSVTEGDDLVSISQTGLILALKAGTATVKATAADGSETSGMIRIKVNPYIPTDKVSVISLSAEAAMITTGSQMNILAFILPEKAVNKGLVWRILSGESCGSVDQKGLFTALSKGTVVVEASAMDGSGTAGTITITVTGSDSFSGGSGTKKDPYLIASYGDLKNMEAYLGKSNVFFQQVLDLDLSAVKDFRPIGYETDLSFQGTYDGNGKKIQNLSIKENDYFLNGYLALFAKSSGATLKNIYIDSLFITSDEVTAKYFAGIVAYCEKTTITGCMVKNATIQAGLYQGGIAAMAINSEITDCHVISCEIGKAVGYDANQKPVYQNHYVGGIAGKTQTNTPEDITLISACTVSGRVMGNEHVGGIAGWITRQGGVHRCMVTGTISGTGSKIGGLVGQFESTVSTSAVVKCCFRGHVEGEGDVGGIYGYGSASMIDCYTTGTVVGTGVSKLASSNDYTNKRCTGQMIGRLYVMSKNDDASFVIKNCYSTAVAAAKCDNVFKCALIGFVWA